jgi:phosphoserine phosphatase RsbU/P
MFGSERLAGVIADAGDGDAVALAGDVESAVLDFSGRRITDDTAIVVVHLPTR